MKTKVCNHDYKKPIRKGRAQLICCKCKKDITLELVLMFIIEKAKKV